MVEFRDSSTNTVSVILGLVGFACLLCFYCFACPSRGTRAGLLPSNVLYCTVTVVVHYYIVPQKSGSARLASPRLLDWDSGDWLSLDWQLGKLGKLGKSCKGNNT